MQMHCTGDTAMLGDFAREIGERGKRRFMMDTFMPKNVLRLIAVILLLS